MAQSTDSNLESTPAFRPNYTVKPSIQWKNGLVSSTWSSSQIEFVYRQPERTIDVGNGNQYFRRRPGKMNRRGKIREARNKEVSRVYQNAEDHQIMEEKGKLGGMSRNEADKNVRWILYLALAERKRVCFTKISKVEKVSRSFKKLFNLLVAKFVIPANIMFERYKLLNRKQKDRKSYEQFLGALSDLARVCKIVINAEQERIKDVFISTLRNCELQRRLSSETLNPVDELNQAIIGRKNKKSCKYRIRWGHNLKYEHSCRFGQSSKFFETESAPWAKTERPTVGDSTHWYGNPGTILLLEKR